MLKPCKNCSVAKITEVIPIYRKVDYPSDTLELEGIHLILNMIRKLCFYSHMIFILILTIVTV